MKRRIPPFASVAALAALLAALALAGCAPAEPPLARVGNETITTADWEAAARGNVRQYVAMGEAGRALLVDELVTRKLFVQAAKHRGFYADTAFLDYGRTQKEQLERELLFRQISGGEIAVSEPEAHAAYERRRLEAHARVIFTPGEDAAREAALELSRGADFVDVAHRFNTVGGVAPDGDLGFVAPGSLVPPLDDWLETAPIGRVMGPVESKGQGWFLMRVEQRRRVEPPPYLQVHDQIMTLLLQRKQRAWLLRNVDWMKRAYDVRVTPGAAARFSDRVRRAGMAPGAAMGSLPALEPDEAAQPLATWSGGTYTLGDGWAALQASGQQPPNVSMVPLVERWIENQVFDRIMIAEAGARRLADDPVPARQLVERQNTYLLDAFYNRDVLGAIQVTDADLRFEYEHRADAFATLERAEVLVLTLPESLTTEQFAMHVGHATNLREAAAMVGLTNAVEQKTITFPSTEPLWSSLQTRLTAMRPGEYAGPFPVQTGQIVIQLLDKQQQTLPWEQINPQTRQQLQTDVINRKRSERQSTVIDSLRRAIPVSVDSAAVRRLQWPLEVLMQGLQPGG